MTSLCGDAISPERITLKACSMRRNHGRNLPGTTQAANIPHYRIPHYHERNFSNGALFCQYIEPYASTIDNFRMESILVPIERVNSGLSIGKKITFVCKSSVMIVHDPKIQPDSHFSKILCS